MNLRVLQCKLILGLQKLFTVFRCEFLDEVLRIAGAGFSIYPSDRPWLAAERAILLASSRERGDRAAKSLTRMRAHASRRACACECVRASTRARPAPRGAADLELLLDETVDHRLDLQARAACTHGTARQQSVRQGAATAHAEGARCGGAFSSSLAAPAAAMDPLPRHGPRIC